MTFVKGRRLEPGTDPETGQPTIPLEAMQPGDYCGPMTGHGHPGDRPAVFFMLPTDGDPSRPLWERGLRRVESPPHEFSEEPDGTLTIRASILAVGPGGAHGWHGYLTRGVWEQL